MCAGKLHLEFARHGLGEERAAEEDRIGHLKDVLLKSSDQCIQRRKVPKARRSLIGKKPPEGRGTSPQCSQGTWNSLCPISWRRRPVIHRALSRMLGMALPQ